MNRKHLRATAALAAATAAAVALTACGTATAPDAEPTDFVSGGTFALGVNDDPGSLSPLTGVNLVQRALVPFAYESMAQLTPDGETVPWMAERWEETSTTIAYTLKEGITCADGTPFTAETAAANVNFHADPDNGTFWHGSNITADMSATADGNVMTITSSTNNPFLLASTGGVEMVCQAGLDDPETLTDATNGTALFQLSDSSPGSSYTYTRRDDWTWGPDGVTAETVGLPDEIEARVVTDAATAANLLLSGDLNAAAAAGSDADRLEGAGLASEGVPNPIGEMLFNERADRPTADERVRRALTLGLDRAAIAELVTDGDPVEMRSMVVAPPYLCVGDGPEWSLPEPDAAAAAALLDEAGWTAGADGARAKDGEPLTIRFLYDAGTPGHGAAAEEVQAEWDALGITTELVAEDPTGWSTDLYETFDWDTGFIQLAPGTPVVLSLFYLGATPEEGGYNFMAVENPEYEALARQAQTAADSDSACELWRAAEQELVDRVDGYPLAQTETSTFFSGATADFVGTISPTSIRMVG